MGEYRDAAVCRRGHVLTRDVILHGPPSPRCPDCGALVLTKCEQCDGRIRGVYKIGHRESGPPFKRPDFCDLCGSPHPWASRQARLYELENILDEQDLDEATRLTVREELKALREAGDMSEEDQKRKWLKVKKLAPGVMAAGGRIVESLVSAAIKASLDL